MTTAGRPEDVAALTEDEREALGAALTTWLGNDEESWNDRPVIAAVESILAARHTALTARLAAIEAVALPGTLAAMRQVADDAAAATREGLG